MVTYFVVQAYQRGKKGMLVPDEPKQARNREHCMLLAEKCAGSRASVVAFSRSGDPTTGDWNDAVVLAQYGEVPAEMMNLTA